MEPINKVLLPAEEIPLISEVDVAVIGGSFAGISSALVYANQGKRVIVVESRTYLGSELTASNKPWIELDDENIDHLPDIIKTSIHSSGKQMTDEKRNYVVFHKDKLKKHLEDRLIDSDIKLLYASLPIGISTADDKKQLMIANKSGRQIVRCKQIIDATDTALSSFLCNQPVNYSNNEAYYHCVIEFDKVNNDQTRAKIEVPKTLEIKDDQVSIYEGYHGNGHLYVSFYSKLPAGNHLEADEVRETKAKKLAMDLTKYLIQNESAFSKALLCSISDELEGPFPLNVNAHEKKQLEKLQIEHISLNLANVYCFYYDFYRYQNNDWLDVIKAAKMAEKFASTHVTKANQPTEHESKHDMSENNYEVKIPINLLDQHPVKINVDPEPVHDQKQTKILVAGGGSSGGMAAITAASEGLETTLIDMNPGLGGTGTFGGVDSYWFGRVTGYAKKLQDEVDEVERHINFRGGKWNIEAKKHTLLSLANQANVDLMFNSITFGSIVEGNRVCGAIVATKWGVCSIIAECVIDATGDGDIAAFAGADYTYGSERDHLVMWYSLAQFQHPGRLQNNFTSMVNISDIEDYTRAILVGRRRDRGEQCHDHGTYVATRESRHIVGDVTMTMTDQLLHRTWSDVINIHFSNHDMKGMSHAEWLNIGLIPPNLNIEIPYRMLLPKGLEGILVAGKAISATHDAFPSIRMQADLENLGAVVAIAAAESVKKRTVPRNLNVQQLQKRMVQEALLPEDILNREENSFDYSEEEMQKLIDNIEVDEPLYEYSRMKMNEIYEDRITFAEISTVGPKILPQLREAHEHSEGIRKIRLAQALAMYEDPSAVETLIDEINSEIKSGEQLPKRTADILYVTTPPDHGAMPDVCYLLYSLGMIKDNRSLPVWEKVVEMISPYPEDYEDKMWAMFYYVHAVCYAAETFAIPEFIPILERLHEKQALNNQQCNKGIQPNYYLERRAMLELSIGRALARCGSEKGYEILINYLTDVRSLLRKQAHKELCELTGENYENNPEIWIDWVKKEKDNLPVKPYTNRPDFVYHNEQITRDIS